MFGSNVLEIGIGLVFSYLALSLVVTALNELVAASFRSRARDLERGIGNLLDGHSRFPERWWQQLIFRAKQALTRHRGGTPREAERRGGPDCPINGLVTFNDLESAVAKITNTKVREALLPLVESARADITHGVTAMTKFGHQVEVWFDHAMDRVSGWYKQRTQVYLFVFGLTAAVALNVDTIAICRRLGSDDTLRAAIVESARQYTSATANRPAAPATAPAAPPSMDDSLTQVRKTLGQAQPLGIPIGWTSGDGSLDSDPRTIWHRGFFSAAAKVAGLLMTAIAASLGAPFWFDVLNKFMSVRSTGKPPEERPKDPKAVPQPENP